MKPKVSRRKEILKNRNQRDKKNGIAMEKLNRKAGSLKWAIR